MSVQSGEMVRWSRILRRHWWRYPFIVRIAWEIVKWFATENFRVMKLNVIVFDRITYLFFTFTNLWRGFYFFWRPFFVDLRVLIIVHYLHFIRRHFLFSDTGISGGMEVSCCFQQFIKVEMNDDAILLNGSSDCSRGSHVNPKTKVHLSTLEGEPNFQGGMCFIVCR